MKPRKKSKFFTFIFSLLPGAGEMYMGFMKTGISLMILFVSIIAVAGFLQIPVLIMFLAVIWFYGFFHVHHLRGLSDVEFEKMEDNYLFGLDILSQGNKNMEKYRNWFAYVMIGLGAVLLWQLLFDILELSAFPEGIRWIIYRIETSVPKLVVGILVIMTGIRMIKGKKELLFSEKPPEQTDMVHEYADQKSFEYKDFEDKSSVIKDLQSDSEQKDT